TMTCSLRRRSTTALHQLARAILIIAPMLGGAEIAFASVSHTITASAGSGGTVAPAGAVAVSDGASQGFTIAASVCNQVLDVKVDGVSVGAVTSYTFNNVTADHTIAATFTR